MVRRISRSARRARFVLAAAVGGLALIGATAGASLSQSAAKGDRLTSVADLQAALEAKAQSCRSHVWPNVPVDCLAALDGTLRRVARTVTVETRLGENTSVLTRVPITVRAAR
jgi:hypothetical protein